jgi:hypothetical protein
MQSTSSSLRYVNCGPGHIRSTYSSAYLSFNIQLKVAPLLLEVSRQLNALYTAFLVPNTERFVQFTLCELWSRPYTKYLQLRIFMLQYSAVGICAAIVDITSIQCALYSNIVPNTAHILQFPLCELWTRPYARYLQLRIFRLQYSAVGICAAIVDITWIQCTLCCKPDAKYSTHPPVYAKVNCGPGYIQSIYSSAYLCLNIQLQVSAAAIVHISSFQCAIYCKLGAKYSAHPPVYAMWTVVPAIYKVFTAPHI